MVALGFVAVELAESIFVWDIGDDGCEPTLYG
jgi:hypothetical protein